LVATLDSYGIGAVSGLEFNPAVSLLILGQPEAGPSADGVIVWETDTWQQANILSNNNPISNDNWIWDIAWSPDGNRIALADGSRVVVWDIYEQQISEIFERDEIYNSDIDWSADDNYLVTSAELPNSFTLWQVSNGEVLYHLVTGCLNFSAEFSPDSRLAAITCEIEGEVILLDVIGRQEIGRLDTYARNANSIAWSYDGHWLAASSPNIDI
jgi:WD40 repeat protein